MRIIKKLRESRINFNAHDYYYDNKFQQNMRKSVCVRVCAGVRVCALIYYAGKSKALSSLYLPHYSLSHLSLSLSLLLRFSRSQRVASSALDKAPHNGTSDQPNL